MKCIYKKLSVIMLSVIMVISLLSLNVLAENKRVWGQVTLYNYDDNIVTLTTDSGDIKITLSDDLNTMQYLGKYGYYTLSDTNTLISYEAIPEYGYELGYLTSASYFGNSVTITNDKTLTLSVNSSTKINGTRYSNDSERYNELKSCNGIVGFICDNDVVTEINYISTPKEVISESKFNAETGLFGNSQYKLTVNTLIYDLSGNTATGLKAVELSSLKSNMYYDVNVMSYDKDYNARLVTITNQYSKGYGYYYSKIKGEIGNRESGYLIELANNPGSKVYLPLEFEVTVDGVDYSSAEEALNRLSDYHGVIEYRLNGLGRISDITTLTSHSSFSDLEYDGVNKLGDYDLSTCHVITLYDGYENYLHEEGTRHKWCNEVLNTESLYSGDIYTLSDGSTVLWANSVKLKPGNPVISFNAMYRYDYTLSKNYIGLNIDFSLNGYVGGGTAYIAIYNGNKLYSVEKCNIDADSYVSKRIYIEGLDDNNIDNYSVAGFAWDNNMSPIINKVPVTIR